MGVVLVLAALGLVATAVVLYEEYVVETWSLERRARELVALSEALAQRAATVDQRRLLETLGAQPKHGSFFRFDERPDEAQVVGPERPRRGTPVSC